MVFDGERSIVMSSPANVSVTLAFAPITLKTYSLCPSPTTIGLRIVSVFVQIPSAVQMLSSSCISMAVAAWPWPLTPWPF